MTMAQRSAREVRAILAGHDRRGPEYALVECIECDSTARVEQSSARSDGELVRAFESMGWTISPTRCPAHARPKSHDSENGAAK